MLSRLAPFSQQQRGGGGAGNKREPRPDGRGGSSPTSRAKLTGIPAGTGPTSAQPLQTRALQAGFKKFSPAGQPACRQRAASAQEQRPAPGQHPTGRLSLPPPPPPAAAGRGGGGGGRPPRARPLPRRAGPGASHPRP